MAFDKFFIVLLPPQLPQLIITLLFSIATATATAE